MMVAKILLLLACTLAVYGCATYSNPYEPGRGDYVERDIYDPFSDDAGEPVVDIRVADVAYYPWWSVDYYYFGSHYYRPAYLRMPGYYPGYTFGYPAYYWPYYGFFSPFYYPYASYAWYDPWTGFPRYGIGLDVPWLDVYWARRYREQVNDQYDPGYLDHGDSRHGYPLSREEVLTDARDRAYPGKGLFRREAPPISREVWTAPSMNQAASSMDVRSRRERKIQESHIGPAPVQPSVGSRPSTRVISAPSPAPASAAPGMMRDVRPSQPGMVAPRRQANPSPASSPSISRQIQPPPSMPAPIRGPSDSGSSPYSKSGNRERN